MSSSFDRSNIGRKVRGWAGVGEPRPATGRHVSRRDREQQNTRMLVTALAIVAVLALTTLVGGLVFETAVKPSTVLAEVGEEEITRRDYWKYRTVSLYDQAAEYEEFAEQVEGSQRTQFLSFAASFREQADDVWGTTDVSEVTLAEMVEDKLYLQAAEELNLDLSAQAVEAFVLQQFAPEGAELVTPYPEPTLIPERAAWATETAEAAATADAAMMEELGTPAGATPASEGAADAVATPADTGTPVDTEEAAAEASIEFAMFQQNVFDDANLSLEEYYELVALPELARELVTAVIGSEVPQTADQVKASHILVSTGDLATELYNRATGGADFSELARTNSIDTATAPTGGELGWFTAEQMVDPFSEVAFNLQPGEISEPVQTEYGWHIIRVEERQEDRPLTDLQYQQAQERAVQEALAMIRAETDIDSDFEVIPTPTPAPTNFNPPPNAPTPIPATPAPEDPQPTPVVVEGVEGDGTPIIVGGDATPVVEGPTLITPEAED